MSSAQQILQNIFGFDAFRPGQQDAVDALVAGQNVLTVMPTGSGKSLCFQIPALMADGLTIVISPLVALMQDQVAALRLAGVAADTINSSLDRSENVAAWRRAAAGETKLLYMAPERLMTERMLSALLRLNISLFAVDEAHCISQWGPSFRPEYADLARLRDLFPDVPIAALTATADAVTREDIAERLFAGDMTSIVLGFDRPSIKLSVETKREWKRQLVEFVGRHVGKSGIVYCLSRKKTEEAASILTREGVRALPYHAGMDKSQREINQNTFMTEPGVVIVATIAFGMGIDKADVRYVFHTDLPGSIEAYYQEIGRAGRDGAPAEAHMIYGMADIRMRRVFIEEEDTSDDHKRREHKRLDALLGYCEAPSCRRTPLLSYFGEQSDPCGNCDNCLNPTERVDGTEDAQKILSAVFRSGERFGAAHIIDILRGSETEKVIRAGHDRLPAFGTGADRKKAEWQSLIRQMVAGGFLKLDIQGYGGLGMTEKARALLEGEESFHYRAETVAKKAASRRKSHGAEPDHPLTAEQADLLGILKELRLQLAKERGVPAYVVFPDRSLIDMARRAPQTIDDFAQVNGVGAAKLKDFAEPFLAVINSATVGFGSP